MTHALTFYAPVCVTLKTIGYDPILGENESRLSVQHSSPLLLIRRRNTLPSIYFGMAEVNPAPATAVQLRLRKVLVSDELDDSCLDILRSGVCYFVDYRLRSYSWRKRKSSVGAT